MSERSHRNQVRGNSVFIWPWPLAALALTWVALLVLFRDTASAMVTIWWRSATFNHCFLILPISAWLVWRRHATLTHITPSSVPWLLVGVAALALLWLMGDMVAVNSVTQIAFVALLVLSVPAIMGFQLAKAITFPLLFLFFGVPLGEFLMPQLMDSTADFTVWALRLTGVPVLREGLQFVIPTGSWSVVEACSGVRYLIASLTVGTLFAYLNYQSTSRRLWFVLVSILVPIIANWLRAYMIVMLGHVSGNTLAVGVDHLIYGWLFFGVVILLMFMVGSRWSETEPTLSNAPQADGSAVSHVTGRHVLIVAAAFVVLAGIPEIAKWGLRHTQVAGDPKLTAPDGLSTGWRRAGSNAWDFRPAFQNTSAEVNEIYLGDAGVVGLYLGYYRNQDYERKLVSSENVLVTSKDPQWARSRAGTSVANLGQSMNSVRVRTAELRSLATGFGHGGTRILVWQLYWIDGMPTANDYLAKIYGALKRLTGHGDESAVIILYTEQPAANTAENTLSEFLAANYASIDGLLRRVRNSP